MFNYMNLLWNLKPFGIEYLSPQLLVLYVVLAFVGLWKLFNKAGEPGVMALIPIVNIFFIGKITHLNPYLVFCVFIPWINLIFIPYLAYEFVTAYDGDLPLLATLIFFPPVALMIMAFSDKYEHIY